MNFLKKIPTLEQISPVYAVIVVMIYTWSLTRFFWRLPSWLYYSTLGEIAVIFAYMMVVNLLESVLVLLGPLILSIVLRRKWFFDHFVTRSTSLILLGLGYIMIFYVSLLQEFLSPWIWLQKILLVVFLIFILSFLIDRVGFLKKLVLELSNRVVIFLYVWIPVSILSLLIVLVRNLF